MLGSLLVSYLVCLFAYLFTLFTLPYLLTYLLLPDLRDLGTGTVFDRVL